MNSILVLTALAAAGNTAAQQGADSGPVAIMDVNVIPMDRERVLVHQTVVVRNGRITQIGSASTVRVPADALRIPGEGRYLIPGLADMHVHVRGSDAEVNNVLKTFVSFGVTKVFSMGGTPDPITLRKRARSGELFAPDVYGINRVLNDSTMTREQAMKAVEEQKAAGYNMIKVYSFLSRDGFYGTMEAAKRLGMRVIGHGVRSVGLEPSIEEGQKTFVHLEEYMYTFFDYHPKRSPKKLADLEARVPYIAQKTAKLGVWVIPTLEAYGTISEQIEDLEKLLAHDNMKYVPPAWLARWQRANNTYTQRYDKDIAPGFWEAYHFQERLLRELQKSGVKLMAGTDVGISGVVPGTSLHADLHRMVAAGLTPYQALVTATRNPADFVGEKGITGTIQRGSQADLVLLSANPLEDITNTRRIEGVMLRGKWLGQDDLTRLLDEVIRTYRTPGATN